MASAKARVPRSAAACLVGLGIALAMGSCTPGSSSAGTWTVTSPDGRVALTLNRDSRTGGLNYTVEYSSDEGQATAIESSPLGIVREDASFVRDLDFEGVEDTAIDETYQLLHGKRSSAHAQANALALTFADSTGRRIEVDLRAYDEGAAFRYRFPDQDTTHYRLRGEATGFRVPEGTTAWMMPYDKPSRYTPAYENTFRQVSAGEFSPTQIGWAYPALFHTQDSLWVLVTESGLDGSYAGTHLRWDPLDAIYRVSFPDAGEGMGVGDRFPSSTLPWNTPWRVIMVGDSLSDIAESSLVSHLAPPPADEDWSWVRPGRASWSWWSASDSPRDPAALRSFIDLAANMGWEYSLIDANWNLMPQSTIVSLVQYAAGKGVGMLLWYNSGGPHNVVTEQPRDRLDSPDRRREEFEWLESIGVKGIKVDFFQSDKQERIANYIDIFKDAARFHLMVDTHGSTLPRGWSRTYPNLMSMEAVQGAEQYKFNEGYPALAPAHNVTLAFTRNVVGPMDYTPVTFSDVTYPHQTTDAHELALSVVFESGLQHFADRVEAYRDLPDAPRQFLQDVPAAWDETHLLAGYPGSYAVFARRKGDDWYVGGISGENAARHLDVPLSFLPTGSYDMVLIHDGATARSFASTDRTVEAGDTVALDLLPDGGFVMHLSPGGARE